MVASELTSKVAVIGAGSWGKNLVRNFYHLGALAAVCDPDQRVLSTLAQTYSGITTCENLDAVMENSAINAVAIASPAVHHYSLAKKCLSAGKDVFVEKPLAMNVSEGQELVALAERRGLILMVGHVLQYHSAVWKLKELIDTGELGKIRYIYSNRLNIGKIRTEENILWSFAPHDISIILALLREMPENISVHGEHFLQTKVADVTLTALSFPSGVKAHIFVSWLHPFKEQKLVIVGDKQMAVFDDVSPDKKLMLYPHQIEWIERVPVARKAEGIAVPFVLSEPLENECRHFLECGQNRLSPKTNGHEGLRVLKVLQAAQQSLNQQGAPVRLSESAVGRSVAPYFVHETAVVDMPAHIGRGTKIWHFSHILRDCRLGDNCNIGQNVVIGPGVTIGNGCKIQNNVSIYHGVTLEDFVFCGPSMVFTNVLNPRAQIPRMDEVRPTLVKTGATIGANATIVCGKTIGRYAFVGAGAVVTKDVPDYALVAGNPARQIGWMCSCGTRLKGSLQCEACGQRFKQEGSNIMPVG